MTEQSELMEQVAEEGGPQAAGTLAWVLEQQAREREQFQTLVVTIEVEDRIRKEAFHEGYLQGRADMKLEITSRLFGYDGDWNDK
jgi:hypothetical protein